MADHCSINVTYFGRISVQYAVIALFGSISLCQRDSVALAVPPRMCILMSSCFLFNFRVCTPPDCFTVLNYIIRLCDFKGPQCKWHYKLIDNCRDSAYILIWFMACSSAVLLSPNSVDNTLNTRICIVWCLHGLLLFVFSYINYDQCWSSVMLCKILFFWRFRCI